MSGASRRCRRQAQSIGPLVPIAVYSSGAIGRLVPGEVVGFLAYIQSRG
ncbi:hypothetical protein [Mycobacterium sp.]|nr:hypothetical protein [Mycobacterium sp.]